jgi:hypothetical protein
VSEHVGAERPHLVTSAEPPIADGGARPASRQVRANFRRCSRLPHVLRISLPLSEHSMAYERDYSNLFQALEDAFGKLDTDTITAIIGFSAGGPVSMCKR